MKRSWLWRVALGLIFVNAGCNVASSQKEVAEVDQVWNAKKGNDRKTDNSAPVAKDLILRLPKTSRMANVTLSATDPDGNDANLKYEIVNAPSFGTLSMQYQSYYQLYRANDAFGTSDSFTYRAFDGTDYSNVATVSISLNNKPIIDSLGVSTNPDTPVAIKLTATDADNDLIYYSYNPASHGKVFGKTGADLIYVPNPGFIGTDSFVVRAYDRWEQSGSNGTVLITVEDNPNGPTNPGTWDITSADNSPTVGDRKTVMADDRLLMFGGSDYYSIKNNMALFDIRTNRWASSPVPLRLAYRAEPSMVWTGSRVIVWGGTDWSGTFARETDDGMTFDPGTMTWKPMARAPFKRSDHATVWTGERMLIWGGVTSTETKCYPHRDGAIYNPQKNTWGRTKVDNAPSARTNPYAGWVQGKMVIFQGMGWTKNCKTSYLKDGGIFDLATSRWTPISAPPASSMDRTHDEVAAVFFTSNKMVVAYDENREWPVSGRYLDVLDVPTNTWENPIPFPYPLVPNHTTGVALGQESLLLFSGTDSIMGGVINIETRTVQPVAYEDRDRTAVRSPLPGKEMFWTGRKALMWGGFSQVQGPDYQFYDYDTGFLSFTPPGK
ncbi:MAG: hypothetical protein HY537_17505 [Deltaproteobacteria bacterium]|nr:hypothetical protein [Deltaproteobacteria bacterium]